MITIPLIARLSTIGKPNRKPKNVMEWRPEADAVIRRVPYSLRKRARARVEQFVREAGNNEVSLADVRVAQARFLTNMEAEISGYRLENCFGAQGCPYRVLNTNALYGKLDRLLKMHNLEEVLRSKARWPLRFQHEFSVAVADCPNACPQPLVRDIGVIAASVPAVGHRPCSLCGECIRTCAEGAIFIDRKLGKPVLDMEKCVMCGQCVAVCPTHTLLRSSAGFRLVLGGKLGRHPRLGMELPGLFTEDEVLHIARICLSIYKYRGWKNQEGFPDVFRPIDFQCLAKRFGRRIL